MSISYIVKIALEHYEKRSKTNTGSNRKMVANRRQQSYERSFSRNSSSDESASSQESNFSTESEQSRRFRKIEKLNPTQMFLYLSLKKRSKGSLLLHYLENSENIQWKKNGEVVYKQKVMPNSNIITLITHAIQNNKSKPVGMKSFYKILAKANIPSKLI